MNKGQPRVSLGMPVYNGENFIEETLDSILTQTFEDFELIISDNASTDKTEEICRAYAAKDSRIRYYRNQENLGAAPNYNRVVELSTGEYFKWAAHDDLCAPELLERTVAILDQQPSVVVCYTKTITIDENGEVIAKHDDNFNLDFPTAHERFAHYQKLVRHGHLCHPIFGLIRLETMRKTPLLGSYPSHDLVYLGELALHGKFYEVSEYLFFKREHPANSMQANLTYTKRLAWADPKKKGKVFLNYWTRLFDYLSAIRRVDISWDEKVRCYIEMERWIIWNSFGLTRDLVKAATWPFVVRFIDV